MRDNIKNLLVEVYEHMTSDELGEIGVFVVTAGKDVEYCHAAPFKDPEEMICAEEVYKRLRRETAMEMYKHSHTYLHQMHSKDKEVSWSPEKMAEYAFMSADAFLKAERGEHE